MLARAPLVDLDPLSAGYSELSCLWRTGGGYRSGIALPAERLVRTFEQLGYDMEQMRLPGVASPAMRLRDIYLSLEHDASVLARTLAVATATSAPAFGGRSGLLGAFGCNRQQRCTVVPIHCYRHDLGLHPGPVRGAGAAALIATLGVVPLSVRELAPAEDRSVLSAICFCASAKGRGGPGT